MGQGPSDQLVYHAKDLATAEQVRKLLMSHDPRPCVYVYPVSPKDKSTGYDVKVSTQWGTCPPDEFVKSLKSYLGKEFPPDDQEPS